MPEVREARCTNCGASLEVPALDAIVRCQFCGTSLSIDVPDETQPLPVVRSSSNPPLWTFGLIGFVLMLAAVGVAISAFRTQSRVSVPSVVRVDSKVPSIAHVMATQDPFEMRVTTYTRCFNRFDHRTFQSRARYWSWAGREKEMRRGRIVYGLYEIVDPKDCKAQLDALLAAEGPKEPHAELDATMSAYMTETLKLYALIKEVAAYYDRDRYKDDGFKKGEAYHGPLLQQFAAYVDVRTKLAARLDAVFETYVERFAQKSELAPTARFVKQARFLVRVFEPITWQQLKEVDKEALENQVAALDAAAQALEGSRQERAAEGFVDAVYPALRKVKGEGWSTGERMRLRGINITFVDGTPGAVIDGYNRMADQMPIALRKLVPAAWQ